MCLRPALAVRRSAGRRPGRAGAARASDAWEGAGQGTQMQTRTPGREVPFRARVESFTRASPARPVAMRPQPLRSLSPKPANTGQCVWPGCVPRQTRRRCRPPLSCTVPFPARSVLSHRLLSLRVRVLFCSSQCAPRHSPPCSPPPPAPVPRQWSQIDSRLGHRSRCTARRSSHRPRASRDQGPSYFSQNLLTTLRPRRPVPFHSTQLPPAFPSPSLSLSLSLHLRASVRPDLAPPLRARPFRCIPAFSPASPCIRDRHCARSPLSETRARLSSVVITGLHAIDRAARSHPPRRS